MCIVTLYMHVNDFVSTHVHAMQVLNNHTCPSCLRRVQVERRSTKNVADLLEELISTNKAVVAEHKGSRAELKELTSTNKEVVAELKGFKDAFVKAESGRAEAEKKKTGAGTTTKTAGAAFNPFKASVGALGGDLLRITFPKDAALIADANVKMYQCKFTYLKNKKLDEKRIRVSAMAHAETERTFACVVPAWGEGGAMPEEAYFTTNLQVFENGRAMPEPTGGQVVNWTPQAPDFKFVNVPNPFKGPAGKAKEFSVAMSVINGYGEAGYKDVKFSFTTATAFSKIITKVSFGGDVTQADRTMKLSVTHPKDSKKLAVYFIDVTITSAKYKLSSKHRITVKFKVQTGLGEGGAADILSDAAVSIIKKRIVGTDEKDFKLCYSSKLHGWGWSNFHNRCDNKGKLMVVMRRPDNQRVFGGFYKCASWQSSGGYQRGNSRACAAMFRINPDNKDKVDWLEKHWHNYYVEYNGGHLFVSSLCGIPRVFMIDMHVHAHVLRAWDWTGRRDGLWSHGPHTTALVACVPQRCVRASAVHVCVVCVCPPASPAKLTALRVLCRLCRRLAAAMTCTAAPPAAVAARTWTTTTTAPTVTAVPRRDLTCRGPTLGTRRMATTKFTSLTPEQKRDLACQCVHW